MTIVKTIILELKHSYHIVPRNHPWVLTAQAPKLRAANYVEEVMEWFNYPQLSLPTPNQKLPTLSLRLCSAKRSQPSGRESLLCKKKDRPVASLPSSCSVGCLRYVKFMLYMKNATDEATNQCNLWCWMLWRLKRIRMIAGMYVSLATMYKTDLESPYKEMQRIIFW